MDFGNVTDDDYDEDEYEMMTLMRQTMPRMTTVAMTCSDGSGGDVVTVIHFAGQLILILATLDFCGFGFGLWGFGFRCVD